MFINSTTESSLEGLSKTKSLLGVERGPGEVALPKLQQFTQQFSQYLTDTFDKLSFGFTNDHDFQRIVKTAGRNNHAAIINLNVPKPAGMRVSYLEYLEVLNKHAEQVLSVETEILAPFEKLVMQALGDYNVLTRPVSKPELINVELIRKDLAKVIDMADRSGAGTYGQLVRRSGDWSTVSQQVTALQDQVSKSRPERLQDRVTKLADRMATLTTRLKEAQQLGQIPAKALSDLAAVTYNIAEVIELYASYCYFISTTVTAIEKTEEILRTR